MRKGSGKKVIKTADLVEGEDPGPNTVIAMSLLLDYPVYERLRKLAFEKRKPMRQYIIRGIDKILKLEKY